MSTLADVRWVSRVPIIEDFTSITGLPIVGNQLTGRLYYIDTANTVQPIPGGGGGAGTVTHTVGALANHALVVGSGVSVDDVKTLTAATNGQIPVGVTGADPTLAVISGDATMDNTGALTLIAVPSSNIAMIHRLYGGV